MILVTGGTGFIGKSLVQALIQAGEEVRMLLRPSKAYKNFPRGISVEVAVSSFTDERSLKAATKGVDTIYHLAGAEHQGLKANLNQIDVEGTATLLRACKDSNVKRFFYLSHHGADRGSAYPVMKAKGISENRIIQSGIPYTIFRSGAIFGPGDHFTVPIAKLLKLTPVFFLLPGDGTTLVQPLWVEDFVTCMLLAAGDEKMANRTLSIGGIEAIQYLDVVKIVMEKTGIRRKLQPVTPDFLRRLTLWVDQIYPKFPISIFWLDELSVDRITGLDSIPREFGLIPSRFKNRLDFLSKQVKHG